jgi:hypothetical protein
MQAPKLRAVIDFLVNHLQSKLREISSPRGGGD